MSSSTVKEVQEVKEKPLTYAMLLKNKNYRNLISGQLVSDLGDGVFAIALIWAMKVLTGSPFMMSLLLAAEILPIIFFGVFAGVVVDRENKKKLMFFSDLLRGLTVLFLYILWIADLVQPWMLIVCALILPTFSAFFTPARTVAVRNLVPDNSLVRAQSIASIIQTIVGLAAPVLAALLIQLDLSIAILFNAFTFFISTTFILLVKNKNLTQKEPGEISYKAFIGKISEGFSSMYQLPVVRILIVYLVLINFLLAPISLLFPVFVEDAQHYAFIQFAFFSGVMLGALLANLFDRFKKVVPITVGLILILIPFSLLSILDNIYVSVFLIFISGLGMPMTNVTLQALFIAKVPKEILGRAASSLKVLLESAKPLSIFLAGILLNLVSVQWVFLSISILGMILVVFMLVNRKFRSIN